MDFAPDPVIVNDEELEENVGSSRINAIENAVESLPAIDEQIHPVPVQEGNPCRPFRRMTRFASDISRMLEADFSASRRMTAEDFDRRS